MSDALKDFAALATQLQREPTVHRLRYYKPYPKQIEFHNARGANGKPATQKLMLGGNQVGKTICGAAEVAFHLTGLYPEWWAGVRFPYPPKVLVSGVTNELVRDKPQEALFGEPKDERKLGTGMIPIDRIGARVKKPGVPGAYDSVMVRHVSGKFSSVSFRCYEQGAKKFMSVDYDVIWCDEEPPGDVWSQCNRATFSKTLYVMMITATPEEGVTQIVGQFLNEPTQNQAVLKMAWKDAAHMTPEMQAEKLKTIKKHERDMRTMGDPFMGAGLVFPFQEEDFVVEPFEIPRYWPQIGGMDFGFNHPFAAARLAVDRDTDVVYVTATYRKEQDIPVMHCHALKDWGLWLPWAWPQDGLDKRKDGREMKKLYTDEGLNLLPHWATNFEPGVIEGKGGNSLEASIMDMYERFEEGSLKVFSTCLPFLEERRMYRRRTMENGKVVVVDIADDTICAVRYAHMMLRFAQVEHRVIPKQQQRAGLRNW